MLPFGIEDDCSIRSYESLALAINSSFAIYSFTSAAFTLLFYFTCFQKCWLTSRISMWLTRLVPFRNRWITVHTDSIHHLQYIKYCLMPTISKLCRLYSTINHFNSINRNNLNFTYQELKKSESNDFWSTTLTVMVK